MKRAMTAILALLLVTAVSHAKPQPSKRVLEVRGFRIDATYATNQQLEAILPALVKQLEIVDSANLPERVAKFFRTVPIVLNPASNAEYAQVNGRWVVSLRIDSPLPENKPMVLHELLHAFHHQVLGQPTPEIARAYAEALRKRFYPAEYAQAHFLDNEKEYFAVIGSLFLFGPIQQPPFNCAITMREQPGFVAYLNRVLGAHECR